MRKHEFNMQLSRKPELCIKLSRKPIHYTCLILKKIIRPKGPEKKNLAPILSEFFFCPDQNSKPPPPVEHQMDRALDTICVNLRAKMLLQIQTVRAFIKIISISDEDLFSETTVRSTATKPMTIT